MIRVTGFKETAAKLKAAGNAITQNEVEKILITRSQPIANTMKQLAPKHTGRLSRSVVIKPKGFIILIGPDYKSDGKGTLTIPALTQVAQHGVKEYEVSQMRRAKKKNKERGFFKTRINGEWVTVRAIRARPGKLFVQPALDANKEQVEKGITMDLKQLVVKKLNTK